MGKAKSAGGAAEDREVDDDENVPTNPKILRSPEPSKKAGGKILRSPKASKENSRKILRSPEASKEKTSSKKVMRSPEAERGKDRRRRDESTDDRAARHVSKRSKGRSASRSRSARRDKSRRREKSSDQKTSRGRSRSRKRSKKEKPIRLKPISSSSVSRSPRRRRSKLKGGPTQILASTTELCKTGSAPIGPASTSTSNFRNFSAVSTPVPLGMGGFSSAGSSVKGEATAEMIREAQIKAAQSLGQTTRPPPVNINPDDWFCHVCTTHNYSTKTRCYRCQQGVNPARGAGYNLRSNTMIAQAVPLTAAPPAALALTMPAAPVPLALTR